VGGISVARGEMSDSECNPGLGKATYLTPEAWNLLGIMHSIEGVKVEG